MMLTKIGPLLLILVIGFSGSLNADSFSKQGNSAKANVKFSFDVSSLRSSSYQVLMKVIHFINDNMNNLSGPIEIDGYTDSVGDAEYNRLLSIRRAKSVASYMKNNGVQTSDFEIHGNGESNLLSADDHEKNRRVEITVNLSSNDFVETSDDMPADTGFDGENNLDTTGPSEIEESITPQSFDRHKFSGSLASLHTELASETSSGSTSSDEVLSEVRLAATLDYSYYLSPRFYLKILGGIRWYEYEEDPQSFIQEKQTNWSYRFSAGLGYELFDWWDINLLATYDTQLYYFVSNAEVNFDIEPGFRLDLENTFRLYEGSSWNFKVGLLGGYLFGADRVEGGYSYAVRPSIGFMKNKNIELYGLYQVNQFDVATIDIKHEILELGLAFHF